jgi:hypothetical protein
MKRLAPIALAIAVLALALPTWADDITGSNLFLCTTGIAVECKEDGECQRAPVLTMNVPHFIEFDLENKTISTTEASQINRSTEIKHLERNDGLIALQGYEQGRVFSFSVTEQTGRMRMAVVSDDEVVVVFGVCTPFPTRE